MNKSMFMLGFAMLIVDVKWTHPTATVIEIMLFNTIFLLVMRIYGIKVILDSMKAR